MIHGERQAAAPTPPSRAFLNVRGWVQRPGLSYLVSLTVGIIIWELVARQLPGVVFASPGATLQKIVADSLNLKLPLALAHSLGHMVLGYALALVVAIPLGLLMGRNEKAFLMLDPVVNALYAIPTVAFVPFLIIWFGLFFESRTALVFIMCVFDILVTVTAGARNIEPALLEVGRSFGVRGWQLVRRILLPASLPFLFTALRIGLARAVNAMITAELFLATVYLGKYMQDSAARFDSAGILAVIVILCIIGLGTQGALKRLEAHLLPWHVRT
jgi:NitT/TauT family transport system permease protein